MKPLLVLGMLLVTLAGPSWVAAGPPVPARRDPPAPTAGRFAVDAIVLVPDAEAKAMHDHGVQTVRVILSWAQVEPVQADPPRYDWSQPDADLQAIAAAHMDVALTIRNNPAWAATQSNGPIDRVPLQRHLDFVAAAATRYGHPPYTVRQWELSNEEDFGLTWGYRAADYVGLLRQVRAVIKAESPDASVTMGGLAYDAFIDQDRWFVRSFLADFLAAGGGDVTDAINFHSYSNSTWPSLAAVITSIRATMDAAHVHKPLIITEAGAPSRDEYGGNLELQAAYVSKLYVRALTLGVESVTWFPFQDFTPDNEAFGYFTSHGMLRLDGTAKPSAGAYRTAGSYLANATAMRPLGPEDLGGSPGAEGGLFRRPGGGGLAVAWSEDGPTTATWPAAHVRAVSNLYGLPLPYQVADGDAIIPLNERPVYIELDAAERFPDVPLAAWYAPFVEELCARGAIRGFADNTFRPFTPVTRAEVATMLASIGDWPRDDGAGQAFRDVPPGNPYYRAVQAVHAAGVASGYADGGYHPDAPITRGQLAAMIMRLKRWQPPRSAAPFADVAAGTPFASAIAGLFQHGVVNGYADRRFLPYAPVTRAQVAKMLQLAAGQP
ncbi:MAG TPA: S-layer homology domain-containing protein [Chloroflexia bacterium]|nr:S-layer homology domain-containing protein [Chloroflexia bacterium]